MYDIALNSNSHDIVIAGGDVLMIDDKARIAQQAKIRLLRWRGEWFLNTRDGLPYIEHILVKNPNLLHVRELLHDELRTIEGVKRVSKLMLSMDRQNRVLTVNFALETDYGTIERVEVIGYGQ